MIDTHFLQFLESKDTTIKYASIDSEVSDLLVDDNEAKVVDEDNKTSDDKLVDIFKTALGNDKLKVEAKALKSATVTGMVVEAEYVKRMKNMSHFMQGQGMPAFDDLTLVVNANNNLVKDIVKFSDQPEKKALVTSLCQHVFDLAKMSKQQLTGEELQAFITRSNGLMSQLSESVA